MQPSGDGVLQVEPTDHCNLSCRMCAPHFEGWETVHGVPKGYLDPELWARVVDGFVRDDLRFDHIIFQWLGDPSLHPQLGRLIGDAARGLAGRVGYLRVDTNLVRLTPGRIDDLLARLDGDERSPPLLIVVTIDAHSAEAYAHVKGVDALARVRQHVRHLVRARRGVAARVNLQLQFVVQEGNADEVAPFADYWLDLLECQGDSVRFHDELCFKRLSVSGGAAGQAAADDLYERALDRAGITPGPRGGVHVLTWADRPWQQDDAHMGARTACPGLWLTPVIRQDGHLLMCCADLHSSLDLGSLEASSFRSLWDGTVATSKRLEHLAGQFSGACVGCGGINWYQTTPEMMAAARQRGRVLGLPDRG
jgi:hypothetical protein